MNKYISMLDVIIIAVILFGPALYSSFQSKQGEVVEDAEVCEFSTKENIYAFMMQAVQLSVAMLYLKFRGVDPFRFQFHISVSTFLYAILLFSVCGFCMDVITSLKHGFHWIPELIRHNVPILSAIQDTNIPLLLFSVLNGFYEEFFFLAVWSYVEPKYSADALAFMLVIRVLIHTYQGWPTALAVGIGLGVIYCLLFTWLSDNLFIYVLSHILADLFGLSLFNIL